MSWCRFGWHDSDLYVYESDAGIECCGCALTEGYVTMHELDEILAHFQAHRDAGHTVLADLDDVAREWAETGDGP